MIRSVAISPAPAAQGRPALSATALQVLPLLRKSCCNAIRRRLDFDMFTDKQHRFVPGYIRRSGDIPGKGSPVFAGWSSPQETYVGPKTYIGKFRHCGDAAAVCTGLPTCRSYECFPSLHVAFFNDMPYVKEVETSLPPRYLAEGSENLGTSCWDQCGHRSGPCDFCGTGMCCRRGSQYTSNECDGTGIQPSCQRARTHDSSVLWTIFFRLPLFDTFHLFDTLCWRI